MRRWETSELNELRRFAESSIPIREIARRLNRSYQSVAQKLFVLKVRICQVILSPEEQRERKLAYDREWRKKNYAHLRIYQNKWARKWRKNNPEKAKDRDRRYKGKYADYYFRYRCAQKMQVLAMYGGPICICCGEENIDFLTVEHSFQDGKQHRLKAGSGSGFYGWLITNDFPQDLGLEVLCWNCQMGRRYHSGVCSHEVVA